MKRQIDGWYESTRYSHVQHLNVDILRHRRPYLLSLSVMVDGANPPALWVVTRGSGHEAAITSCAGMGEPGVGSPSKCPDHQVGIR